MSLLCRHNDYIHIGVSFFIILEISNLKLAKKKLIDFI